jgi:hypothetical protein
MHLKGQDSGIGSLEHIERNIRRFEEHLDTRDHFYQKSEVPRLPSQSRTAPTSSRTHVAQDRWVPRKQYACAMTRMACIIYLITGDEQTTWTPC